MAGMTRTEEESRRTLMLRIAGEVDPSLKKALKDQDRELRELGTSQRERTKEMEKELMGLVGSHEKYTEAIKKHGSAENALYQLRMESLKKIKQEIKGLIETQKEQGTATKKQTTGLRDFIKALRSGKATFTGFIQAIGGGTTVLAAFGVALAAIGVKKIIGRLQTGFQNIVTLLKNIGKAGIEAFKTLASAAIDVNSKFEQIEITLRAITRSEEAAAAYMRTIQNVAMATGRTMLELGAASRALIPITGGDPRRLEEMLNLALRLQMLRPEIPLRTATRAISQFLTGRVDALVRTFQIPSELIQQIQEQGLVGLEALQKIFKEMRLGQELIDEYKGSWEGLNNTLKDFGQRTLRGITAPAFEALRSSLEKLVGWLGANTGQIEAFVSALGTDIGAGFQQVADMIFGVEGFGEEALFRVAEWGANLIASLVHGLLEGANNFLIPALVQVTELIASFLRGMSPPARGVLATIDQWFGPIIRAYLSGFSAADFTALSDIGNIIKASLQTSLAVGAITQEQFTKGMLETRSIMVQMVEDIRNFGQVSAGVWSNLSQYIGIDVQLIEGYLDLVNKVKAAMAGLAAAQAAMAAAQAAYAEAMKKVKRIQEELRLFELKTADIPERYKRGRRLEIEFRLMAAQKEAQLRQEAVTAAREQVKAAQAQLAQAKQMLSAYKQMITALQQLAKAAEDAVKAGEDGIDFGWDFDALDEAAKKALTGNFLKLLNEIHKAFEPVKEDFKEIMAFFRGLLGIEMPQPKVRGREARPGFGAPEPVGEAFPEAYALGERLRDAFVTIAENLPKIGEGFSSIVAGLQSIVDWYNGQPEWVQNLVGAIGKVVAITIALHWLTAGLSTGLAMILASVGIKAATAIGIPWLLSIGLGIVAAKVILTQVEGADKSLIQDFLMKRVPQLKAIIEFYVNEEGLIQGVRSLIDNLGKAMAAEFDNLPWWLKALLYMTPFGPGLEFVGGLEAMGLDITDVLMPAVKPVLDIPGGGEEVAGTWIQGLRDTISGADKEVEEAAKTGIFDPLIGVAEDIYEFLFGKSIFPEMMDAILKLFRELPSKLLPHLQHLVTTIQVYGESAAQWWDYAILQMQYRVRAFVQDLYYAIGAIQHYLVTVAQMSVPTVPAVPGTYPGPGGPQEFQMGGYVDRLQMALLHPGEVVLSVAQTKNVAAALAMPQMGGVSPNVTVDQRNWRFAGALTEAERGQLKKMAKEASFEGIREAFTGAQ